jgi:uncharacterized delta-60 repeat protein
MDRVWKTALAAAMIAACLAAMAGGAWAKPTSKPPTETGKRAKADAGELDSSFGKGGKVTIGFPAGNSGGTAGVKYTLPFEFTPGHLEMAASPGGKTVVAGATKVARFLTTGKLDPSFGSGGTITVPAIPGRLFVLAGVAVDSQGRVVLAGLSRPVPTNTTPDPVLSQATLIRFTADGTPDPSFGNGGVLVTDFGLGAPKAAGGPYGGASVGLRDITIDAQNRIVVSGGYVTELADCTVYVDSKGFVARLTEAGALDPTFGEGGIRSLESIASLGVLEPRPGGYLALGRGGPSCNQPANGPEHALTSLDEDGNLAAGFGSFGFRGVSIGAIQTMTVTPSGKILLLSTPQTRRQSRTVKKKVKGKVEKVQVSYRIHYQEALRLLPSGAVDPGFSRGGELQWIDPVGGSYTALTANEAEEIYVVGKTSTRVSKSPKNTLRRQQFVLAKTEPKGGFDKSFGTEGQVVTGFGGPTNAFATQVMLDAKGRIVVGGGIVSPQLGSGGGFALARYLPGS